MIYIYDIVLNWTDTKRIYDFFEWDLNDNLEHIKKIPFFKIEVQTMNDFMNNDLKMGDKFLNLIKYGAEIYTNKKSEKLRYASLFSDGFRALAIEFDEIGNSICKSKLLLDEEEDVVHISKKVANFKIDYEIIKRHDCNQFVTRFEEEVNRILLTEINNCYKNNNYDKLKYFYIECFGKSIDDIDIIYNKLLSSINNNTNNDCNSLYEIVKLSCQNKN